MGFTAANQVDNILILTNTDPSVSLLYTIHVLDSTFNFVPITSYPTLPTNVLTGNGTISVDLINDGIYKIIFGDLSSSYVLFDANIKLCEKTLTLSLWCNSVPTKCECDSFTVKMYNLLKFKEIKKALYFEWNKWVQSQSVTDLITPTSNELLSMSEWLTQLSTICVTCSDDTDCGCSSSSFSNCGCS